MKIYYDIEIENYEIEIEEQKNSNESKLKTENYLKGEKSQMRIN